MLTLSDIISFIFTFLIVWSVVFFMALPIGIKPQKKVKLGNDPGAPANPNLKPKIIGTTIVSIIIAAIIIYVQRSGIIDIGS